MEQAEKEGEMKGPTKHPVSGLYPALSVSELRVKSKDYVKRIVMKTTRRRK